jgi:hypothetical protein
MGFVSISDRSNRVRISATDIGAILNSQPKKEYIEVEGLHPFEYYPTKRINFNR